MLEEQHNLAHELARLATDEALVANFTKEQRGQLGMLIQQMGKRARSDRYYDLYPETGPLGRRHYPRHIENYAAGKWARERCLMGGNKTGKELPDFALLPTPSGFKKMGEIRRGDRVLGGDGKAVEVIGVYPQGEKELYRVVFTDDSEVLCGREHLWTVRKSRSGKEREGRLSLGWRVRTTWEMQESGISYEVPGRSGLRSIDRAARERKHPVPPYLLGLLLGDGSISHGSIQITTPDEEIRDYCGIAAQKFGCRLVEHKKPGKANTYAFSTKPGRRNRLVGALKELGLMGKNSHTKFIPEGYLWSSWDARLALLQGLMDTDGTVEEGGTGRSYSTVSEALAQGVLHLAHSLGMDASLKVKQGRYNGEKHFSWRVMIHCGGERVFRLKRKADLEAAHGREKRALRIKRIERTHIVASSTCLKVANVDGLYLTENFIPTHNTEVGAFESTAHLTGEYPDWWAGRKFEHPIEAIAAGKTNETTRDIIQSRLFGPVKKGLHSRNLLPGTGMVPASRIVHESAMWRTGISGTLNQINIRWKDSELEWSTLNLKAYQQGRGSFEGLNKNFIWLDEEPHEEIYGECLIRTGTVDGIMLLTFTPLEGFTDVVLRFMPAEMRPTDFDEEYTEF